jgi:hypothetical protein
MDDAELRADMEALGWTPPNLAARLGVTPTVVRRWMGRDPAGPAPIPDAVARWVRRLADLVRAHPPPIREGAHRIRWRSARRGDPR